ncbi:hypothetical protein C0995_016687 [Termitomyces sp. Mi166|nr:hypothetical protein C0995_016687 [Termitomyces sp. Mi166\
MTAFMTVINSDVSYALVKEAIALYRTTDLDVVLSLASTCRVIRQAALSVLFAQVHWPHGNKHDEESGLHFFPATLWPYFKSFQLIWPEDWPEATPPRWGDRYYVGGDYNPRHIDKLVAALPAMSSLSSFYLSCPFYPPNSLLNALIQCRSLRDLSINETPLSISMSPRVPNEFHLDRLSIVPVAEAVRVGDGPFDRRYTERTYYVREYRKKYKNDVLARGATTAFLFDVGKTAYLRHVQLSTDLCSLQALAEHHWPVLDTLILTGHAQRGNGELLDVIAKMPALCELRLLFAKRRGELGLRILPEDAPSPTANGTPPTVLRQLRHLAVSNACNLDNVFQYTTSLERLAILAIIDQPRVSIALSRADIDRILGDLAVGHGTHMVQSRLRRLRIMIEDKVNPDLCSAIAARCPNLEALEIELCGYHDGKSIHAWVSCPSKPPPPPLPPPSYLSPSLLSSSSHPQSTCGSRSCSACASKEEFSDALAPMSRIRELRLCIQFPEFDEMDPYEPWRAARQECARFLAARMQRLQRVGFEYRKRTGTHRFEDNWLEFEFEREGEGDGESERDGEGRGGLREGEREGREGPGRRGTGVVSLRECGPTWYPFPEVWIPVPAQSMGAS